MTRTSPWAILLVFLSTLVNASAQTPYKLGSANLGSLSVILTNYYIWIGLFLYGVSALMLVIALKYGELSVLYPVIATSFIWVNLIARYFFHEDVGFLKWLGIVAIMLGLTLIGLGEFRNQGKQSFPGARNAGISEHKSKVTEKVNA